MENREFDFIYFGLTFEQFDVLDFTDDFLAGVRSNYFNSNFEPQTNRAVQFIGNNEFSFIYTMKKGEPLSWKVNKNGAIHQSAEKIAENVYRVNTYNESGRVFKRMYFDFDHFWLKSEYFGSDCEYPEFVLFPSEIDSSDVLVKIHNSSDSKVKSFLYPKYEMPEKADYSALAYSDRGFVYFNTVPNNKFISKTLIRDSSVSNLGGFCFDSVDFNLNRNLNKTFDITAAEYLTEENGNPIHVDTNAPFNPPQPETRSEFAEEVSEPEFEQAESAQPDAHIDSAGESYSYFGQLENGKRAGYGRTLTAEGKTAYEGEYADDKRDGFGAFYYKDGKINYVGNWAQNARSGFGVGFRRSDGSAHIGKWDKNNPSGLGARFDKEGNFIFLGNYVDGKKQGKGITVDEDGSFIVSEFRDDEVLASYKIDDLLGEK